MDKLVYADREFKIGTRVYIDEPKEHHDMPPDGSTGVVVSIADGNIGVEFDQPFPAGHSCSGNALHGRGRYYTTTGSVNQHESISQVHVIKDDDVKIEESEDLLSFINSFAL